MSAFDDRTSAPAEEALAATLGAPAFARWTELRQLVASSVDPLTEEWGFTSEHTGWTLRLKQGKRAILYLTPCVGQFLVSLSLGERALRAAPGSGLPTPVLAVVDAAPRYAEGTGIRLARNTNACGLRPSYPTSQRLTLHIRQRECRSRLRLPHERIVDGRRRCPCDPRAVPVTLSSTMRHTPCRAGVTPGQVRGGGAWMDLFSPVFAQGPRRARAI